MAFFLPQGPVAHQQPKVKAKLEPAAPQKDQEEDERAEREQEKGRRGTRGLKKGVPSAGKQRQQTPTSRVPREGQRKKAALTEIASTPAPAPALRREQRLGLHDCGLNQEREEPRQHQGETPLEPQADIDDQLKVL